MCKISRSILCILHKRRCARFPDPYSAYFTNDDVQARFPDPCAHFINDDVQDLLIHTHTSQTTSQVFIQKKISHDCQETPKKKFRHLLVVAHFHVQVIFIPSARCSWASRLLPPVPPSTTVSPERALASSSFRSAADDILAL